MSTLPTFVGYTSTYGLSNTARVQSPHASTITGDLLIWIIAQNNNGLTVEPSGWTRIKNNDTAGTLSLWIYVKIRAAGETSYTFTPNASAGSTNVMASVRGWTGNLADLIIGASGLRASNATSSTSKAPSITTLVANTYVLHVHSERTTATETDITSISGATKIGFVPQNGSSGIETVTLGYTNQVSAGAVGDSIVTYPNTQASNGWAFQLGIPPAASNVAPSAAFTHSEVGLQTTVDGTGSNDTDGTISAYDWDWGDSTTHGTGSGATHTYASAGTYTVLLTVTDNLGATGTVSHSVTVTAVLPATGQVGIRASLNWGQSYLTIGFDKIGGSVLECVLYASNGTTELTRQTMTNDGTTGWGNCNFTGLTANTVYKVKAIVDGVTQTDLLMTLKTLKTAGTPQSFTFVAGSCNFTSSNHPIWDNIAALNPEFVDHMGDDGYMDATTEPAWRAGVESTMTTAKRIAFHSKVLMAHNYDNHDRIITNPTGAGTGLNLGETDPATNTEYRQLAGTTGWSSSDTLGRSWQIGRVLFIATDHWSVRDDGDGDPAPRKMMGATQKAWFKALLTSAASDNTVAAVVWFCQWTSQNDANGRWDSFPEETAELAAHINALANNGKRKLLLVGGDSHILQADSGVRTTGQGNWIAGVPSLNISGFNRSSDTYSTGNWNIAEAQLRTTAQAESDWGGYGKWTVTDNGAFVKIRWEAIRVNVSGTEDRMAYFEKSFGQPGVADKMNGTTRVLAEYSGLTQTWQGENYGAP